MDHVADFVSGWVAGCAGTIVSHPMDTVRVCVVYLNDKSIGYSDSAILSIKNDCDNKVAVLYLVGLPGAQHLTVLSNVRLQTQGVVKNSVHQYTGMIHCLKETIQREKVRGLFKGMLPPLLGTAAWNAVVFGTYGNVMRYLSNGSEYGMHDLTNIGIASLATSFTQSLIICPTELVKSRLQVQACEASTKYKGPLDCVKQIVKQKGFGGLFKGMKAVIIRDIPGFPSYFMSFELLSRCLIPKNGSYNDLGVLELMLAGGVAGTISWTLVFSPDVIKARIQLDYTNTYNGVTDCFVKSVRSEGLSLFTKGLLPTMIRGFTMNAAIFPVHILLMRHYYSDLRPMISNI